MSAVSVPDLPTTARERAYDRCLPLLEKHHRLRALARFGPPERRAQARRLADLVERRIGKLVQAARATSRPGPHLPHSGRPSA